MIQEIEEAREHAEKAGFRNVLLTLEPVQHSALHVYGRWQQMPSASRVP